MLSGSIPLVCITLPACLVFLAVCIFFLSQKSSKYTAYPLCCLAFDSLMSTGAIRRQTARKTAGDSLHILHTADPWHSRSIISRLDGTWWPLAYRPDFRSGWPAPCGTLAPWCPCVSGPCLRDHTTFLAECHVTFSRLNMFHIPPSRAHLPS